MDDHAAGEVDSQPERPPAQQLLATLDRARALTIGNALRVPGSPVRVSGRAVAGPGGPLQAPLSGLECVWYRSVVFRHERGTQLYQSRPLVPMHPMAQSDAPSYARLQTAGLDRRPVVDDHSSTAPFGLDDGTGVILVDPAISGVDTGVFAINTVVTVDDPARDGNALGFGGGPFDHQELHTEWIVPIGAPLIALGTVGALDGRPGLLASGQDAVLITSKPEQQIRSRSAAAVDPSAAHLPLRNPRSVYVIVGAVVTVALAIVITLLVLFVVPH